MSASFWNGKRVVVAGGAGFIGSHVTELLVDAGSHVRVVDNLERGQTTNLARVWDRIEFRQLDLLSFDNCLTACDGREVLLNLAARESGIGYSASHHGSMMSGNTLLALNLLEAARQQGVERVLVVSSASVYADDAPNPIREEDFTGVPERAHEGYAWGKMAAERQAAYYVREYGMRVAVARADTTYGPRDTWDETRAHAIPALIKKVLDGEDPLEVWGSGEQSRAFVYVRDVAQALLLLTEHYPVGDPVNVGHDHEIRVAELVRLICRLVGREPRLAFDPAMPEGAKRRCLCPARLRTVTGGFAPQTALEPGLRETIDWFAANYERATSLGPPLLSIVTPVYCEDELIASTVNEVKNRVGVPYEMLVVYDFDEDTTVPVVRGLMPAVPELKLVKNTLGPGPVNAVRTGIRAARGRYIVVVNGDLSDEMSTINAMVQQARAGHDLVCGSRYMAGGRKVGGPFVQDLLSRCANAMFRLLTRFPTADVTNSFKLYRADFLRQTPIESTGGFEFSMELAVKGYARGLRLCEVPTVWKQRKAGESRFRLLAWLRNYLRWFFAGLLVCWFGRRRHDAQSGAGPTRIEAG